MPTGSGSNLTSRPDHPMAEVNSFSGAFIVGVRIILKPLAAAARLYFLSGIAGHAIAAEGAASNYFPGAYGTLLVAVAPEPGPLVADLNLFYSAEADRAVLQGRANADVEIDAFYTLLQGFYIWDAPAIGGRFGMVAMCRWATLP